MDSASFQGIFALLFYTNFVELFTVLTLLRFGLGFYGGGIGLVMGGLALAFAVLGVDTSKSGFALQDVFKPGINLEQTFREDVMKLAKPEITDKILEIKRPKDPEFKSTVLKQDGSPPAKDDAALRAIQQEASFPTLVASSIFSQIIEAFKTGAKLLLPFLVIDVLLGVVISALGVVNFSVEVLSTPLKIIFFVAVGGWELMLKILA